MTVMNNTTVALEIMGGILAPNESREYAEMMFNTLDIHSEIGSCVITTEYSQRSFRNSENWLQRKAVRRTTME